MYLGSGESIRTDRRGSRTAIPTHVDTILTQQQRLGLNKIENFGWRLAFIRQPMFEPPVTIVTSPDRQKYAVLERDGEINMHPDIVVRH